MENQFDVRDNDPAGNERNEKTVFDPADFLMRYEGDLPVALEVLQAYTEDLAGHLSRMETYLDEEKTAAIKEEAHSLKGASGYVSATEIYELAQSLITDVEEKDLNTYRQEVRKLKAAAGQFCAVTQAWQKTQVEASQETNP